jgi:hypothetical protein
MFLLGGCADARLKRQASLLNVKTHVARDEYNAAPTPEAKLVVADAYFRNAADMTQIVENGLFGRPPTAPVVLKP